MDSYQFYKSLYDRELNRRKDLEAAINLPITILTILVASNLYLNGKENYGKGILILFSTIFSGLIAISFMISIFYLIRSYTNLFKGFAYKNFALTTAIRKFELIDMPNYNEQVGSNEQINFEKLIIEKLTEFTDDHIIFNDKKSLDLHKAKTFIIVTLVLTAIKFLPLTFKYLTA